MSSLTFDPVDANVAYATYSTFGGEHVWRSGDGGASWVSISGSGTGRLPDVPVHDLVVDPGNRSRLYVGTDIGVFVSLDGGAQWARENAGFANVIVERLAIAPDAVGGTPMLFAFTYGRGVWRVPLTDFDGNLDYSIDASASGGFFDPAQDGHGWTIEIINIDGVRGMVATWYTYLDGEPVWLYGIGAVDGDSATIPLSISRGGDFPPEFDPSQVQIEPWGEVQLTFTNADSATASWTTSRPGFNNGSMALTRLARINSVPGDGVQGIGACHSGSWFEPSQSGHGLQFQVIGQPGSEALIVAWFAYLDGAQRWLFGAGPVSGNRATVPMSITRGAQFPPEFNTADVVRDDWGTLEVEFSGPNDASIAWQSQVSGFGTGALALKRVTSLEGHACQ